MPQLFNFTDKVKRGMSSVLSNVIPSVGLSSGNFTEVLAQFKNSLITSVSMQDGLIASLLPLAEMALGGIDSSYVNLATKVKFDETLELTNDDLEILDLNVSSLDDYFKQWGHKQLYSGYSECYSIGFTDNDGVIYELVWCAEFGPVPFGLSCYSRSGNQGWFTPLFCKPTAESAWELTPTLVSAEGTISSCLYDKIRDMSKSSTLSTELYQLIQSIELIGNDSSELVNIARKWIDSSYEFISAAGPTLLSAVRTGGVYGAVCFISSYFNSAASAVEDDGSLVFTKNQDYMTSVWGVGLVTAALSVAAGIVSAITAIFSPLASLAIAAVGSLVTQIGQSVNYDYNNQTVAAVNTDWSAGLLAAPLATGQRTFTDDPDTMLENLQIPNYILQGSGFMYTRVPGGYEIFTVVDGTMKVEFHPDLLDRIQILRNYLNEPYRVTVTANGFLIALPRGADAMEHLMDTFGYAATGVGVTNTETGALDASDDEYIRKIICCNLLVYWLYCVSRDNDMTSTASLDFEYSNGTFKLDQNVFAPQTYHAHWGKLICTVMTLLSIVDMSSMSGYGYSWNDIITCCSLLEGHSDVSYYMPGGTTNFKWVISPVNYYCGVKPVWGAKPNLVGFYDTINEAPAKIGWAIRMPKYDRASFWTLPITLAVIGVVSVVVGVVAGLRIRKWLRTTRFTNALKCESAHETAKLNPTEANIRAYDKAVLKNNVFAKIFGGTKFSRSGFWSDASSNIKSSSSSGDSWFSPVLNAAWDKNAQESTGSSDSTSVIEIVKLIKG